MFAQFDKLGHLALLFLLVGCSSAVPFETQILKYDGNKVAETFVFDGRSLQAEAAGQWAVDIDRTKVSSEATDYSLTFRMEEGALASGGAAVQFTFDNWSTENYIFAPCYLYGGNRFNILKRRYVPFIYENEDRPADMPITTSNVPHFNRDGSDATVDFRTNSCSTPLAGFYDKAAKRGFFILTEQDTVLGNEAFFISEYPADGKLTIRLSAPGVREHRYVMCNSDHPSDDEGIALKAGDAVKMHFRVYDFSCEDLPAYFQKFFTIRKDLTGQNEFCNIEPFTSVAKAIYKHHFDTKWYEDENFGYICNRPWSDWFGSHLAIGWAGAPVYTLNQLAHPDLHPDYNEILRRVSRTFDSIAYMQAESGLFYTALMKGELYGEGDIPVSMPRRTAITIYYGLQCLEMLRLQGYGDMIKPEWEEMLRKASDALCTYYERYGEFGRLFYITTGDYYLPNSTNGALAMGALAYASKYFGEPEYLALAEKAADYYYENHLAKGYVGGGPGDILDAPDSEASAELAESYTAMYEITRDEKWLKYACDASAFFSTWVVSYDYKFPETSGMGKMGMKATGSVWASVQNQHGAPGIYVMSGDFLLKLYRATGDRRYLDLCQDMAHNVTQYVNTEVHRTQAHGGIGYCTERVNLGDWEGEDNIGGLADDDSNQAWENVALIHTSENPGIYVRPDTGELTVFDHVTARIVSSDAGSVTLEVTNPTPCDGDVSVLAETSARARSTSLGFNAFYSWPKVHVPAGQTVTATLPFAK